MAYDNLDSVLIDFSDRNISTAEWTIRHAVEGVQIFGGIGSGKTSGSGRLIALKTATSFAITKANPGKITNSGRTKNNKSRDSISTITFLSTTLEVLM